MGQSPNFYEIGYDTCIFKFLMLCLELSLQRILLCSLAIQPFRHRISTKCYYLVMQKNMEKAVEICYNQSRSGNLFPYFVIDLESDIVFLPFFK